MICRGLLAALGLAVAATASGQTVQLGGTMGRKALLVIDGQPATLAVGESAAGVTLLQLGDGQAVIRQGGATSTLRIGSSPVQLGGSGSAAAVTREIVIPVGLGGHYTAGGAINGRPVRFMVDTGATLVALGQAEADRLGLDWRRGERALSQTAGGTVPVHRVSLGSVRVGEVELNNIGAVVVPAAMPYVLLGNSFLARFQLRRDSDVLRLELKR
jgi:aspartyl protease family protein